MNDILHINKSPLGIPSVKKIGEIPVWQKSHFLISGWPNLTKNPQFISISVNVTFKCNRFVDFRGVLIPKCFEQKYNFEPRNVIRDAFKKSIRRDIVPTSVYPPPFKSREQNRKDILWALDPPSPLKTREICCTFLCFPKTMKLSQNNHISSKIGDHISSF